MHLNSRVLASTVAAVQFPRTASAQTCSQPESYKPQGPSLQNHLVIGVARLDQTKTPRPT